MPAPTTTSTTPSPLNGSATLSQQVTSQPVTLTSAASLMCEPTTSGATPNAISLQASEAGLMRFVLPDGRTSDPHGPEAVPVSRFRARDSEKAMPTNDTSGPLFTASSQSAALQLSLESRLRARTDVNGSPEYELTWKHWDMPAGPPICALRARERRTTEPGFIGWPTPNVPNGGRSTAHAEFRGRTAYHEGKKVQFGIEAAARTIRLKPWPTPMAGTPAQKGYNEAGNTDSGRRTVALLKGWATPRARDFKGNGVSIARAAKGTADSLDLQCKLVCLSGTDRPSPLSARMDRGAYPLNPMHSLWLMGFSSAWESCAEPGMPSSRNLRRRSSQRSSTAKSA